MPVRLPLARIGWCPLITSTMESLVCPKTALLGIDAAVVGTTVGKCVQHFPDYFMLPLDKMYDEVQRTRDRDKRFEIYKKANEYIADQAFWVFTMAPLSLYGVNEEVEFVPQVSQYLYLDYSSVTDNHWSIRGEKK